MDILSVIFYFSRFVPHWDAVFLHLKIPELLFEVNFPGEEINEGLNFITYQHFSDAHAHVPK